VAKRAKTISAAATIQVTIIEFVTKPPVWPSGWAFWGIPCSAWAAGARSTGTCDAASACWFSAAEEIMGDASKAKVNAIVFMKDIRSGSVIRSDTDCLRIFTFALKAREKLPHREIFHKGFLRVVSY
jgi:hypothetical protein